MNWTLVLQGGRLFYAKSVNCTTVVLPSFDVTLDWKPAQGKSHFGFTLTVLSVHRFAFIKSMSLNFFVRNTAYSSLCCDIECHCNTLCSLKCPLSSSLQRRTPFRPHSLFKLTHERACCDVKPWCLLVQSLVSLHCVVSTERLHALCLSCSSLWLLYLFI